MTYEMKRRKPEPTQKIFNLPHNVGRVWEELAFDDAVSYKSGEMDCSTAKCFGSDRICTHVNRGANPVL